MDGGPHRAALHALGAAGCVGRHQRQRAGRAAGDQELGARGRRLRRRAEAGLDDHLRHP